MLFRFTKDLNKKLHIGKVSPVASRLENEEWYAHVFRAGRAQYILITHAPSLFSGVLHGAGVTDFDRFMSDFRNQLNSLIAKENLSGSYESYRQTKEKEIVFSNTQDRRILGSMNDMINMSKALSANRELSPHEMSDQINETPFSYIDMESPKRKFAEFIRSGLRLV